MPRQCLILPALLLVLPASFPAAAPWQETLLASLNGRNGSAPSGLAGDAAGNLYGAATYGGAFNAGTVFRLTPPAPGGKSWTTTVLHSFQGTSGISPFGTLTFDGAGNLYGATQKGGGGGDGLIFQLQPPAAGKTAWTEKVLFAFNGTNGTYPHGGLAADSSGVLYGTTAGGGAYGFGTVFKLAPPPAGKTRWIFTSLGAFNTPAGISPNGNLLRDAGGNLFGTTASGGATGNGTVFELQPTQSGWHFRTLFAFNGSDGSEPLAGLVADASGALYGTTFVGGAHAAGTVFKLSPPAAGKTVWTQTVAKSFSGPDGAYPMAPLLLDSDGNVYGTTDAGGAQTLGTVFRLAPPASGQTRWSSTVLKSFVSANGANPRSLIADTAGNLYGTTLAGGRYAEGTVFRLSP